MMGDADASGCDVMMRSSTRKASGDLPPSRPRAKLDRRSRVYYCSLVVSLVMIAMIAHYIIFDGSQFIPCSEAILICRADAVVLFTCHSTFNSDATDVVAPAATPKPRKVQESPMRVSVVLLLGSGETQNQKSLYAFSRSCTIDKNETT